MPGAVPRTSTFALNNQTADFVVYLADHGIKGLADNPALLSGLNIYKNAVTHQGVAEAFGLRYETAFSKLAR
jgi:alanine dehydrogenase